MPAVRLGTAPDGGPECGIPGEVSPAPTPGSSIVHCTPAPTGTSFEHGTTWDGIKDLLATIDAAVTAGTHATRGIWDAADENTSQHVHELIGKLQLLGGPSCTVVPSSPPPLWDSSVTRSARSRARQSARSGGPAIATLEHAGTPS